MHPKAEQLFHGLCIFVLMTAFFLLHPAKKTEVTRMQGNAKSQVSVAWQQTIGDGSYFETLADIYDDASAFYEQSSAALAELLSQPDSDQDIFYVFHTTYEIFAQIFQPKQVNLAQNVDLPGPGGFMTEAALDNIVPIGSILGESIDQPLMNKENAWITIQDNFTDQQYCLAIYNGEVNKYLGTCRSDYR